MKFYTHIAKQFNNLYIRGYENGVRFKEMVEYRPYMFITSPKPSKYKTLDGKYVDRYFHGTMRETDEFVKQRGDVHGFQIYGSQSYEYQYINDQYPGEVLYDPQLISVVTLDIETDSEGGFPNIKTADKALTAITIRKNDRAVTFGMQPYTPELDYVTYVECRDERDMIVRFLDVWRSEDWVPDVITGWNVEFFDIPYMINRISRLFDEKMARRLSPWDRWEQRRDPSVQDAVEYMNVPLGVTILDYLALYKKFTFSQQESFRLDHIAFIELGERKLDYTELGFETLDDFYKGDFRNYINYNIRDVDLVYKIDQKMKLLEQVYAIAYDGKVNLIDSLTTVGMWDTIISNYLMKQGIVVPLKVRGNKPRQIEGAYVKDPQCGLHKWVVSFDLNSLYPHLIMQYNISPETLRGQMLEYDLAVTARSVDMFLDGDLDRVRSPEEREQIFENIKSETYGLVDQSVYDKSEVQAALKKAEYFLSFEKVRDVMDKHNLTITPTGCVFDKTVRGFLPTLMETMYNDRAVWKKRMLQAKKDYEKNKTRENENEIARCHNMQLAKKIQLNSAYGALSNQFFRWFDNRLAESITKSGQLSIRWMERKVNEYLNKTIGTKDFDYVIAIDTDSMYITLDKLMDKVRSDDKKTIEEDVAYLDKVCETIMEPFIDRGYQQLAVYVSAYEQKMKMKREAIANKGIWTGKKHYILNVYDLEGVRYKTPKLKMQGIEAVRSSTPAACRENIKSALEVIMTGGEEDLQKYIREFKQRFKTLPFEDIAFPRSVRGMLKDDVYDKKTGKLMQKSYNTGTLTFLPSTPIHVKGALIYNHLLKIRNLQAKYVPIGEGEKIKFCYLLKSSPLPTNVIATPGKLPKELNLDKYIDYETQFEKSFVEPLRTIMEAIGWKEGNEQQTLEGFFT